LPRELQIYRLAPPSPSLSKLEKYKDYELLDHVSALVEQQLGAVGVPVRRSPVQWRLSVLVSRCDVGTLIKEQPDDIDITVCSGVLLFSAAASMSAPWVRSSRTTSLCKAP